MRSGLARMIEALDSAWTWPVALVYRQAWVRALLEGLGVLVLLLGITLYLNAGLLPQLDQTLLGARHYDHGDGGGIFIYWATWHAVAFDTPFIFFDMVCAPGGRGLHLTFPNRLEAFLGVPFYQLWDAPRSHNLFLLSMFAMNAWPAYFFFRALRAGRIPSLVGAVLFGYNAYSIHEIRMGRPVTGFILWFPMVLWPLQRALQVSGWKRVLGWSIFLGVAVSWAVEAYVVFAIYILLACVGVASLALLWPEKGVSRSRPLVVGLVGGLASVVFSAPYVYEVERILPGQLVQAIEGRPQETRPALWEPRLWKGMARQLSNGDFVRPLTSAGARSNLGSEALVHRDAMAWSWPLEHPPSPLERKGHISKEMLALALLLLPVAGRMGVVCFGVAILGYLLTLGAYVSVWDTNQIVRVVLWEGRRLALPTHYLLEMLPRLNDFLRPYRAFPLMLMGVTGCVAAGLHGLAQWLSRRTLPGDAPLRSLLLRLRLPGRVGWRPVRPVGVGTVWQLLLRVLPESRLLGFLLALGVLLWSLFLPFYMAKRIYAQGIEYRLSANVFPVSPFFKALRADPENFTLIELPMGMGRMYNSMQLIHQKARTESMVEVVGNERASRNAPGWCYRQPLLMALWSWQAALNYGDATLPSLDPSLFQQAARDNLRYVVFHQEALRIFERSDAGAQKYRQALDTLLGPPTFEDSQVVAWKLDANSPSGIERAEIRP